MEESREELKEKLREELKNELKEELKEELLKELLEERKTEEVPEAPSGSAVLADQLAELYKHYEKEITEADENDRTLLKTVKHFFSDKRDADAYVHSFYNAVGKQVEELCETLKEEDPETASVSAERALRTMLAGKHKDENNVSVLSKVGNQGFAMQLLQFLTKEQLAPLREAYLKETPKRLMFPNQRKILAEMERLLAQ